MSYFRKKYIPEQAEHMKNAYLGSNINNGRSSPFPSPEPYINKIITSTMKARTNHPEDTPLYIAVFHAGKHDVKATFP